MNDAQIDKLIADQPSGRSLHQSFYRDPDIYERDIQQIFLNSWLYAGHRSELPQVGDYLLFEFAGESVIIVRSEADQFSAMLNVCRHRGSRVCLQATGNAKRLVCPYHGWTYGLDGALLGAAQMAPGFDKGRHGLKKVHLKLFQGLLFVNLSPDPVPFDAIEEELSDCLRPYRLDRAKVAHRQCYRIAANWKLAMENYCECYHCRPAHPEYSRGHALAVPQSQWTINEDEVNRQAAAVGLSEDNIDHTWLEAGLLGTEREHERYPLVHGHLTGSRHGQPVAPLLGDIKGYVGAATDLQMGPTLFGLAYCDHVVLYRFTPVSIDATDCEVSWLVNEKARKGKDYDLDQLTWLWDVTTEADRQIIENNQKGVNSRFFEPGPLSQMENFANRFIRWYLAAVGGSREQSPKGRRRTASG